MLTSTTTVPRALAERGELREFKTIITRIAGDLLYVQTAKGRGFCFTSEVLEGYAGEPYLQCGLKLKAEIRVWVGYGDRRVRKACRCAPLTPVSRWRCLWSRFTGHFLTSAPRNIS